MNITFRRRMAMMESMPVGTPGTRMMKKLFKLAFSMLMTDSHCGKILREELAGLRTLRVKNMRIGYRLSARKVIEVVAIGPRSTIYKGTCRLIGGK